MKPLAVQVPSIRNCSSIPELAIATTDQCQARCAHCLMKSSPERDEALTVDDMWRIIDYLHVNHALRLVVFTGGESTLLGDDLFEVIARCVSVGLGTRLVTNARWAESPIDAQTMIGALREVGLDELNISTDDFHRVWVPLEWVRNAWYSAKGVGFESVILGICSGPRSKITTEYMCAFLNEDIPEIYDEHQVRRKLSKAADGTLYAISNTSIAKIGRASQLRDGYFVKGHDVVLGPCSGVLRPITLLATGELGVCCGLNAEGNLVLSLRENADGVFGAAAGIREEERELLIDALTSLGPAYLYSLATGIPAANIVNRFTSMCELCAIFTESNELVSRVLRDPSRIQADILASRIVSKLR